jgi:uncharacterized protein involved in exopolysaccharide biosynthesis
METLLDIREYLKVIAKRWVLISLCIIGFMLYAFIFSLWQRPVYEASTTFIMNTGRAGGSAQLAGLAGLAGISFPSGGGSSHDLAQIIRSNAVAQKVLRELNLRQRIKGWDNPAIEDFRLAGVLQSSLKEPELNGNFVIIRVEHRDPKLVAEIANGFVNAMKYLWNDINYTEAKNKRHYIEGQLPRIEGKLRAAEQSLKRFTLLSPPGANMSQIISGTGSQGIELTRLTRELEIQNSVYTMLRKEYETVKLEESKEIPPFSVVDVAVEPLQPIKPKMKMNVTIGFILGLLFGIFVAFFLEYWNNLPAISTRGR